MIERPILFSAPMVRAILAGQKTQTRRVVKPEGADHLVRLIGADDKPTGDWGWCPNPAVITKHMRCPYGMPGDRLWVRETFAHLYRDNTQPEERRDDDVAYKADHQGLDEYAYGTWKPSIHMPKWASRLLLEVTEVRVERLQAISAADAMAEGAEPLLPDPVCSQVCPEDYVAGFRKLWDSINAANRPQLPANVDSKRYARVKAWLDKNPDTTGWAANPWVWVVSFKLLEVA